MANEQEPIAKMLENGRAEYTCPICGGWDRLCEVYGSFLPFIDHLIRDLCVLQHPMLQHPRIVNDETWYQIPGTTRLLPGLSAYDPSSPDWKELLGNRRKIHTQAEVFLPDIGDWLERALIEIKELNEVKTSDIFAAERLFSLVEKLDGKFEEQKNYLLEHKDALNQTGTDPKWLAKAGNQARFVADSMAGARWRLTTSSSREMIRVASTDARKSAFAALKIPFTKFWWSPE